MMRIQLVSTHRYPAWGSESSGPHPREYPSGSGYHLHDLLALGLVELGHDVVYWLKRGSAVPMPAGVELVMSPASNVDICHSPIGPLGTIGEMADFTLRHGKPTLLTCHMQEAEQPASGNWVFVSRSLAKAYRSHRYVMNGLNPRDYIYSETKSDYFLFMGAMNKAVPKGLDTALALCSRAGVRLVVAGTGLNYETIHQVSHLCAAAGAEYVGDVRGSAKAELLAGARAVLFPSRLNEGCPLVILEAMLSGTPVISSDCGGSAEIVTPETGILCTDDEQWPAALDRIGDISPARCRAIGLEKYDYRRMAADYVREYEREIESFRD